MSSGFDLDEFLKMQHLKTQMDYNVIVQVGKEHDFEEFHMNSVFLISTSEYFNKIFSSGNMVKKDGKYTIKIENINPYTFNSMYIYTGQVNFNNKTGTELLDIVIASDKLKLKPLTKTTEDFMIENHQGFLRMDPVRILIEIINCNESLVNLQENCLKIICSDPKILFNSNKFIYLPATLLEIVLKRDDLNLAEIEIWEGLIKWGLAQEKTHDQDVTKWNQDDFNHFQGILYKLIPLIRYYEISSDDYFNKVKPYEKVLPKELVDDILKFHTVSGYTPTLKVLPRRPNSQN
ncbi:hypothetical protein RhiirC2_769186 [Rhizophagus irregularis]|uniref:BTB domain-containing protein n=1 Tax=Rhizophagus irregularis TaxID=588596 RepID=A0A2N1NZV8_9GLOM|nr:hypothetical protein RhiirC2_769186 [Rhizophagus irregularis]